MLTARPPPDDPPREVRALVVSGLDGPRSPQDHPPHEPESSEEHDENDVDHRHDQRHDDEDQHGDGHDEGQCDHDTLSDHLQAPGIGVGGVTGAPDGGAEASVEPAPDRLMTEARDPAPADDPGAAVLSAHRRGHAPILTAGRYRVLGSCRSRAVVPSAASWAPAAQRRSLDPTS